MRSIHAATLLAGWSLGAAACLDDFDALFSNSGRDGGAQHDGRPPESGGDDGGELRDGRSRTGDDDGGSWEGYRGAAADVFDVTAAEGASTAEAGDR
jgi:hypothetical protein